MRMSTTVPAGKTPQRMVSSPIGMRRSNAWRIYLLLIINSPEKGCGKTTVLDVVGRTCSRPLFTSNITPAALFRVVEAVQPTLLIDEADSFAAENEELRGVINSGHTRSGAFVIRTV